MHIQMAAAKATAFACTYGTCTGSTELKLNCIYNKVLAQGDPIYVKADSLDKVCSNCEPKLPVDPCINQLCQQEYTSPGDIPERACTAQDDMSNDLQTIATDMHNYYRRLVATGWGLDKDGYAPPAKSMLALKYVCDDASNNNIATATKTLVDTCPDTPPPATAGHTLNHFYMNTLKDSREVFLQKAIENWANEAAKVGVGKDNIFHENAGFNNYGHMMQDGASEVTCAVKICQNSGKSVAICQYNAVGPDDEDPIYVVGKKPCSPCANGKSCEKLGGLCV
ncbi:hypothetical protein Y032_0522g2890 [Ancylostoma ceylanicum]|uniref:SCP domain-containing protein n=2 Tax=Ancylostoma ceylanicum TaxID=53326 RepID=A0A016WST1_9BILA|nr:hypothetical protein Y032_0522g2890 [Ancylostoma ceylanicum]